MLPVGATAAEYVVPIPGITITWVWVGVSMTDAELLPVLGIYAKGTAPASVAVNSAVAAPSAQSQEPPLWIAARRPPRKNEEPWSICSDTAPSESRTGCKLLSFLLT